MQATLAFNLGIGSYKACYWFDLDLGPLFGNLGPVRELDFTRTRPLKWAGGLP